MIWARNTPLTQRAETGHQVSASRYPGSETGWRFSAWAPTEMPGVSFWKWWEQQPMKVHYKRGESVPQRTRLLGVFDTAEAARACCEQDLRVPGGAVNTGEQKQ